MKFLKKFATREDVDIMVIPNVVLIADTGEVLYNMKMTGVYIQHIDGSLITPSKWEAQGYSNNEANGIAVMDEIASFVVSKTSLGTQYWSQNQGGYVEGVLLTSDVNAARLDYAGKQNSEIIASERFYSAAHECVNFEFPNGAAGYLPALGELTIASKYYSEIETALALVGGTSLGTSGLLSSTQYKNNYAWYCNVSTASASSIAFYNGATTRPFTSLK